MFLSRVEGYEITLGAARWIDLSTLGVDWLSTPFLGFLRLRFKFCSLSVRVGESKYPFRLENSSRMLLWIPRPGSPAHHHGGSHYLHHHNNAANNIDDNEKGDKLRRRAAQARTRNILMAVGLFLLAFFATVSQVQYTQKRHGVQQPSLRTPGVPRDQVVVQDSTISDQQKHSQKAVQAAVEPKEKEAPQEEGEPEAADDFFLPHAHLPENSIYRLSLTDVTGNSIDLSQFSGMVSLVVNTACH